MSYKQRAAASAALALAMGAASTAVALHTPADLQLVTHWSYSGVPNGGTGKWLGLFLGPLIAAFGLLPLRRGGWLDGPYDGLARSIGMRLRVWLGLLAVAAAVEFAMLAQALGWRLSPEHVMVAGVGVAIALIGDGLGKSRRMAGMGLRTSSTLASEDAWSAAHRLAGVTALAAGVVVVAAAACDAAPGVLTTVLVGALLVTLAGAVASSRRATKVASTN